MNREKKIIKGRATRWKRGDKCLGRVGGRVNIILKHVVKKKSAYDPERGELGTAERRYGSGEGEKRLS